MKKDQNQGTTTTMKKGQDISATSSANAASARSRSSQASSSPSGQQNAQEARCKATCKAKAKKKSGKSNWPRRSGTRSGKSGWDRWNAKRKAKQQRSAEICKKPSGRFVSKAVRADSPTFQSQGSQTDANFFLLSDLPDAAYESAESELGEFLDDEHVDFRNNNSDDDGWWSPKAYSI